MDESEGAGLFAAALQATTAVQVVEGSSFAPQRKKSQRRIFTERTAEGIADLRAALALAPDDSRVAWMMPGDPTLALFAEVEFLAAVTYLRPGFVRSSLLEWDTPLALPHLLESWLITRGCE